MGATEKVHSMGQPVPELPVVDVERAQQHYRDALGSRLGGFTQTKRLGLCRAITWQYSFGRGRRRSEPAVHWVFAEDVDATYQELMSSGANIVDPLERKPWGLRQFTVQDLDGNLFYFHDD